MRKTPCNQTSSIEPLGLYLSRYTHLFLSIFTLGGGGTNVHAWFYTSALKYSLLALSHQESLDAWVKYVSSKGGLETKRLRGDTTRDFSDPVIEWVTVTWAWLCDWLDGKAGEEIKLEKDKKCELWEKMDAETSGQERGWFEDGWVEL